MAKKRRRQRGEAWRTSGVDTPETPIAGPGGAPITGPCALCERRYENYGHNPEPLAQAPARCCDQCNRDKVIPARLTLTESGQEPHGAGPLRPEHGWPAGYGPGERRDPERVAAMQLPTPVEGVQQWTEAQLGRDEAQALGWEAEIDHHLRDRDTDSATGDVARRILRAEGPELALRQQQRPVPELADALGNPVGMGYERGDDIAQVLRETANEPGYSGTGLHGPQGPAPGGTVAPPVRTPADVAELRNWLVRQWQPGGLYNRATQRAERKDYGAEQARVRFVEGERQQLQRADLYWVAEPMCDLLAAVAPDIPADVRPEDLTWPARDGLVVFARPLESTDALNGEHLAKWSDPDAKLDLGALSQARQIIEVNAVVWSNVRIPDPEARSGFTVCLGISSYRMLDFGAGMSPQENALAIGTGAIDGGIPHSVGHDERDPNRKAYSLTGTVWAPMGRSDWPLGSPAGQRQHWIPEQAWPSFLEDRQRIAALFTLLEERSTLAASAPMPLPRPAVRRAERLGVAKTRNVVVVTLRQPKRVGRVDGEARHVEHDHRWLVRAHPCWQPYGPGRSQRKLIIRQAHVKGPEDKPLVIKTRVNAWVR